jgi:hypothetical protein
MPNLIHQRCANHAHREAVARCPECGRYFCRECITEHEDRVLCKRCLAKELEPSRFKRMRAEWVLGAAYGLLGMSLAWVVFFYLGRVLLLLPDAFHEGTLWQQSWWKGP